MEDAKLPLFSDDVTVCNKKRIFTVLLITEQSKCLNVLTFFKVAFFLHVQCTAHVIFKNELFFIIARKDMVTMSKYIKTCSDLYEENSTLFCKSLKKS